jgi:peptide/nickel transport system permease protein
MIVSPSDSDENEKRSVGDGGTPASSDPDPDVLTRTSNTPDVSRSRQLYITFDRLILAPLRVSLSDTRMIIAILILGGFVFTGLFGERFVQEPRLLQGDQLVAPWNIGQPWYLEFPFGTEGDGRDLYSLMVYSTSAMLKMILAGGLLSAGLGAIIGAVSGYNGGAIDRVLMLITDAILTIPSLALVIVLAAVWTPQSPYEVGLLLGIDNWPNLARTVRSQVLSIREQSYTEASRAMGLSKFTILRKDILSDLTPYITVNLATGSRRIIFESVALYYLGILPFTNQNWGIILNQAYSEIDFTDLSQIHYIAVPMVVIIVVTIGLIMLAQSADRVFNVRLRAKNQETSGGNGEDPTN